MDAPRRLATFLVRVFRDGHGQLIGTVQRARTGERRPFHRAESLGPLIAEMTEAAELQDPRPDGIDAQPGEDPCTKRERES
jgi:hypothetical protein